MFKRVALFIATNLAVVLVLSIVLRLLGVDRILDESGAGINYEALLILSVVIGFGGSFISLAMSKWMAKRSTGAHVIDTPANSAESWLRCHRGTTRTRRRHRDSRGGRLRLARHERIRDRRQAQ